MNAEPIPDDLPLDVRRAGAAILRQQLANALDLGLQAKQAHRSIVGAHLLSLHELFDHVAETVDKLADLIAKRAEQSGAVVEGTVQAVSRDTKMPVYPLALGQDADHVRALTTSLAHFASGVRAASSAAGSVGDDDTAHVLTQASRAADLLLWKVASHLDEPREELSAPSAADSSAARNP